MNENIQALITETLQVPEENIGYRTETTWGYQTSGVRELKDIMFHEMYEMHNLDICDYCLDNYRFGKFKGRHIVDVFVDLLNEDIYLDEEYTEEEAKDFIDIMIQNISEQSGVDCKYGLWLCNSKEDLINNYEANPDDIQAYDTTNAAIISDLDEEGVLYAFEELPEPIDEN